MREPDGPRRGTVARRGTAVRRGHPVRRKTESPNVEVALGWHISEIDGREIVWHNGGTGGYRSYMAYDPARRAGVVVLSNVSTPAGVDGLGLHLLAPSKARNEIKLDAAVLDRYVGSYQLAPQFAFTVTRAPCEGSSAIIARSHDIDRCRKPPRAL